MTHSSHSSHSSHWAIGYLLLAISAFQLFSFSAFGENVTFCNPIATNRLVILTPLQLTPAAGQSAVYDRQSITTDTNGCFTITNCTAGLWQVAVQAPPNLTQFAILVSSNSDSVTMDQITVAMPKTVARPQDYPYSASASDARYAVAGGGGLSFLPQPASSTLSNWSTIDPSSMVSTQALAQAVGAAGVSTQAVLGIMAQQGVATNNASTPLVSYSRPAFKSMVDPVYVGGDTNTFWLFGANPSIPDLTIDYYLSGAFTRRYMFTPEGPLVAQGFGDTTSFPGSNVFTKPTIITNPGSFFAGNGSGLVGINSNSLDAGTRAQLALAGSSSSGGAAPLVGIAPQLTASFFGFTTNGDNYPSMQALAAYANSNKSVWVSGFAPGQYTFTLPGSYACSMVGVTNVLIDAPYATFYNTNTGNGQVAAFAFTCCTNIVVNTQFKGLHTCGSDIRDGYRGVWLVASNSTANLTVTATRLFAGVWVGDWEDPLYYATPTVDGNRKVTVTATNIDTYYGVAMYLVTGLTVTNLSIGTSSNGFGCERAVYLNGCTNGLVYSYARDLLVQDAENVIGSGASAIPPYHFGSSNITLYATDLGSTNNVLYQELANLEIVSSSVAATTVTMQNITITLNAPSSSTVRTNQTALIIGSLGTGAAHVFTNITVKGNVAHGPASVVPSIVVSTGEAGLSSLTMNLSDFHDAPFSGYTFSSAATGPTINLTAINSDVNTMNFAGTSQSFLNIGYPVYAGTNTPSITGDGSALTNLNGGAIRVGTVNSNALDAALAAQLATATTAYSLTPASVVKGQTNQNDVTGMGAVAYMGQSGLTVTSNTSVSFIRFWLNAVTGSVATNHFSAFIGTQVTNSTDVAPGTMVGTSMVLGSALNVPGWNTFALPSPVTLVPSNTYSVMLSGTRDSGNTLTVYDCSTAGSGWEGSASGVMTTWAATGAKTTLWTGYNIGFELLSGIYSIPASLITSGTNTASVGLGSLTVSGAATFVGPISVPALAGARLADPAGGTLVSNLVSSHSINPYLRKQAGRRPAMGWRNADGLMSVFDGTMLRYDGYAGGGKTAQNYLVGVATWMKNNGFIDAGYNFIGLDANWSPDPHNGALSQPPRDANGNMWPWTNSFTSGITGAVATLATYNLQLGLYEVIDWEMDFGGPVSSATNAYNDGLQFAKWGIRDLKLDGYQASALTPSSDYWRYLTEELCAGLDDGAMLYGLNDPIHVSIDPQNNYTWFGGLANSVWPNWVTSGLFPTNPDANINTNPAMRQMVLYGMLTNALTAIVGPGTIILGPGTIGAPCWKGGYYTSPPYQNGRSWWTTNYAQAEMTLWCMAPWELWCGPNWEDGFLDPGWYLYTNRQAIAINQDMLIDRAKPLLPYSVFGTNAATQQVWYRSLANGDVAVACWNLDTNNASQFNVNMFKIPGLAFPGAANVTQIFPLTNGGAPLYVSGTLSSLVQTGSANLFRLSSFGLTNPPAQVVWDADATNFMPRVGLTISSTNTSSVALNTFVTTLKTTGAWTNIIGLYPMIGTNAANYGYNLKSNSYNITWYASPVASATGVVFVAASSQYGDTGFIPSSSNPNTVTWSTTAGHLFAYVEAQGSTSANGGYIGCYTLSPSLNYTDLKYIASPWMGSDGLNGSFASPAQVLMSGDQRGPCLTSLSGTTGTTYLSTRGSGTGTVSSTALPAYSMFVGALNGPSVVNYWQGTMAGASFGGTMPSEIATAYMGAWDAFNAALGRKVP